MPRKNIRSRKTLKKVLINAYFSHASVRVTEYCVRAISFGARWFVCGGHLVLLWLALHQDATRGNNIKYSIC